MGIFYYSAPFMGGNVALIHLDGFPTFSYTKLVRIARG